MASSKDLFTSAFVDLMASALGCVVILMLVFAVKTPVASNKIGKPRGFVYYSIKTEDNNAELEFYFRHLSATANCPTVHRRLKEFANKIGPDTVALCTDYAAYVWGPTEDKIKGKNSTGQTYNFYIVVSKIGDWDFGVRYYDRKTLKPDILQAAASNPQAEIQKSLTIYQSLRTNDRTITDSMAVIQLGDECNLSVNIKQ